LKPPSEEELGTGEEIRTGVGKSPRLNDDDIVLAEGMCKRM
jgi:hypothetical protein